MNPSTFFLLIKSVQYELRKIHKGRTQCTRLPLYARSGRGECRLALPPFMERLLPSLKPETYRPAKALAIAPSATSSSGRFIKDKNLQHISLLGAYWLRVPSELRSKASSRESNSMMGDPLGSSCKQNREGVVRAQNGQYSATAESSPRCGRGQAGM
ncbi:hypothetical protein DVH24_004817 [Malus domestica]|uniref:Uncharacterized protein n=1 Tax=Malus domestica TaxID=3750 RepID=A0A498II54_MALDO|nr:hypothetical protein DVH24_004817 [Malus domestica]